jgi:pyruvate kinase
MLLIHDGEIVIRIKDKSGKLAIGKVIQGGIIAPHMGVNVPSVSIPIPYLQDRDIEFLKELKDVSFVAASFTRSSSDIIELREFMEDLKMDAHIIAKIENGEGIKNIDEILEISDGIMVARGDLGTEIPVEKLPETQKFLLRKSQEYGKPGIIATQILESMIRNPQPTRAEVSDIANAIIDGADALMLSGETAIGKYPVETVKILAKVAEEADRIVGDKNLLELKGSFSESVSNAAVLLASEINANAILALTRSGKTARLISRHRPKMPILAATYSESTLHSSTLYWGVEAFKVRKFKYTENAVKTAIKRAESLNLVKRGDAIVVVGGEPSGTLGSTNFLWVQIVGEVIARGKGYGNKIINGKMCRWPEMCDIVVMRKLEKIEKARGIVIESKIYEPSKLEHLAKKGISILASTGEIKIEKGTATLDPKRGILLK